MSILRTVFPPVGAALIAAALIGCATPQLPAGTTTYSAIDDNRSGPGAGMFVGLGVSGGGNRSALFASYVIELFGSLPVNGPSGGDKSVSFLGTVGYLSSVSGGSFAAAYFGMRYPVVQPQDFDTMLSPGGVGVPLADFFARYHVTMNYDWRHAALIGGEGSSFSTSNAQRLSSALDAVFLDGKTFQDLNDREAQGRSPYLIFNTTHYDTGRRFVMTTIPRNHFCLDTEKLIRDVLQSEGSSEPRLQTKSIQALTDCSIDDPLTPEGFDAIGNTGYPVQSGAIRLSQAVAMSGAFPAVVGPVAYGVSGQNGYLHFIDGGVTDNSGVETIVQLFLNKLINLPDQPQQRALIVELDAGKPFNADGAAIQDTRLPLVTLANDPSRLSDIQEVRALLYRRDLWNLAQQRAGATGTRAAMSPTSALLSRVKIISLRHTDLDLNTLRIDIDDDPVTRGGSCHMSWNHADLQQAMRNLPTDYVLDNTCDVELLRVAACWSVYKNAPAIQAQFARNGRPVPARDGLNARIISLCPELNGRIR